MDKMKGNKPLGMKSYGSIGHLPNSRLGPRDHHIHEGQARICTEKARDKHDTIIVQEKLDGSCTSVARIDGRLYALGRSGYEAKTSPFEQHHHFDLWVRDNWHLFNGLKNGERLVGEWLAQAHGTRYDLKTEPWFVFDLMVSHERALQDEIGSRFGNLIPRPTIIHHGVPMSTNDAMELLGEHGFHNSVDGPEGAVWRVEREGKVDFLAKYVRPEKKDGIFLPEISGGKPVWNWSHE